MISHSVLWRLRSHLINANVLITAFFIFNILSNISKQEFHRVWHSCFNFSGGISICFCVDSSLTCAVLLRLKNSTIDFTLTIISDIAFRPSCTTKFNEWAKQPTERYSPSLTAARILAALSLTTQVILCFICQSWIICLKKETKLALVCFSLHSMHPRRMFCISVFLSMKCAVTAI